MKAGRAIPQVIELDGQLLHLDEGKIVPIDHLKDVSGDKRLVTDFQEGMSRVMTVEGPAKYAELLVKRKLQETGEFEEPVDVFTHWKKKRGKTTTDVFFTAVPSRLTSYYLTELAQQEDITLVYAMYGVLWGLVQRFGATYPVAVVLRHHRFAEVIVGSKNQVYFANRCVAFDVEEEQINALWETVRSDIQSVENEQHIQIDKIIHANWVHADDRPAWPKEWKQRLVTVERESMELDAKSVSVSWNRVGREQKATQSLSPTREKICYLTKNWAPAVNIGMALLMVALFVGLVGAKADTYRLERSLGDVRRKIGQVQMGLPRDTLSEDFDKLLKFVGQLDRNRNTPSYQQIVDDLTQTALKQLALDHLKIDMASGQVRLELSGNIDAPFEVAHGGYQRFLHQMTARGYRVDESRFETQINQSQVVLKLSRPAT